MKNKLVGGWFFAAAVAMACLCGNGNTQAQPAGPDAAAALPPDIAPGTPLAEVVKLVQSGMDADVIKTYIANAASAFNLDAGKIVELNDLGVPADVLNAMMDHDKAILGVSNASMPAPAPAVVDGGAGTAAPTTEVNVNYFNDTLSPYGSWVVVEGYGRCWRPTTVIYDSSWQPYCDRGHWVYSDCGWYWDSDYSWGVTFHYGRWFHHDRFGWCWWPDTVWAPSWVTWRQSDAYCGWAPLPPFAVYRPGMGFSYRGANVTVGFDFGLDAGFFTFVPVDRFCDRHPRSYRIERERGRDVFRQTVVINNFNENHRTIINGGIPVERINAGAHRTITPVNVGAIRNSERQGWRGSVTAEDRAARNSYNQSPRQNPEARDNRNNNLNNRQNINQPNQVPGRNENMNAPAHSQTPGTSGNRNFNSSGNDRPATGTAFGHNQPSPTVTTVTPVAPVHNSPQNNLSPNHTFNSPGNDRPATGTAFGHNQPSPVITTVTPVAPVPVAPAENYSPNRNFNSSANDRPATIAPHYNTQPAPVAPVRVMPQENVRPARNYNDAVISAPAPERVVPQVEQRQFTAPSPARKQRMEQRIEQRQNAVESVPHNVAPPPASVPAQGQQRNAGQNSGGSDSIKQNH